MPPDTREELAQLRRDLDRIRARLDQLEQSSAWASVTPEPVRTVVADPIIPGGLIRETIPPAPAPVREASLESRIGSQWLNRIGIVAVLIGVAYFLKYAFENNWIGASGRIAIGLLTGIAIFVWSERFRRNNAIAFSHSLKAVAVGILYLSLWASFQLYHLVPAGVAFAAMFVVTASTLIISLKQNAQVIAAMALYGGMASPALVSTGENHEIFLFSYLALISIAATTLAILRGWHVLALSALIGTAGYYLAWNSRFYYGSHASFAITLFFVLLFFGIFLVAADLTQEQQYINGHKRLFPPAILLINAVVSFAEIYDLFSDERHRFFLPWMVLMLAGVYLFASRSTRWKPLSLLNVALALGLITIAIPLRLSTHFITLGWLIESAVILYLGVRNRQRLFEVGGIISLLLGIARLVFIDDFNPAMPFLNMRFLLFVVAISITGTIAHFARRAVLEPALARDEAAPVWFASAVSVTVLTLLGLDREISLALSPREGADWQARRAADIALNFTRSALWMVYGAAAMALGFLRRITFYRYLALALLAVTVCKVFLFDVTALNPGYRVLSFIALGVILLGVSYAYQKDWLKLSEDRSA